MNISKKLKKLNNIYSKIPDFKCKNGCFLCCGSQIILPIEAININRFLKTNGIKRRKTQLISDYCPYLKNSRCVIYPVRPVMCRLFGVVKHSKSPANLECPFIKAEKYFTEEEASCMIKEIGDMYLKHSLPFGLSG